MMGSCSDTGATCALLDPALVVVVRDLEEGDEAAQPVLLRRLALDVEPLANADAPKHLGDRVARARAVDGKPLRGVGQVAGQSLVEERARRAARVALLVEVGDELARVGEVLLLLQLDQWPEPRLEVGAR